MSKFERQGEVKKKREKWRKEKREKKGEFLSQSTTNRPFSLQNRRIHHRFHSNGKKKKKINQIEIIKENEEK